MSVSLAAVGSASFLGRNGAGSISVPGLKVGDMLLQVHTVGDPSGTGDPYNEAGTFEMTVTVDDEIQQLGAYDRSALTHKLFFARAT